MRATFLYADTASNMQLQAIIKCNAKFDVFPKKAIYRMKKWQFFPDGKSSDEAICHVNNL